MTQTGLDPIILDNIERLMDDYERPLYWLSDNRRGSYPYSATTLSDVKAIRPHLIISVCEFTRVTISNCQALICYGKVIYPHRVYSVGGGASVIVEKTGAAYIWGDRGFPLKFSQAVVERI